jgi:voltage-gated potassium channel
MEALARVQYHDGFQPAALAETRVATQTEPQPRDAVPPSPLPPSATDELLPTWAGILDLATAVLAALWVPVKLGLLAFPAEIDFWFDMLFVLCAGPCAWHTLHAIFNRSQPLPRHVFCPALTRALVDLTVALPAVTLAGLTGAFPEPLWCLKLVAVRHVFRLPQILARLGLPHPALGRLITLAVVLPLALHWTATGWIMLGADAEVYGVGLRYVRAMYWAITTTATVGYGDIVPRTAPQMLYACCVMVAGVGLFGFVLGNVASLLSRLDTARLHHEGQRERLEEFMRYHRVPVAVRQRVRDYFRCLWESRRGYDAAKVLVDLPPMLRADLLLCVNRDIIQKVPLLKDAGPNLVRDLVIELTPRVALPGEEVFRQGMPADGLYFILSGEVEILNAEGEPVARLQEGGHFGEMALLTRRPRSATARASSHCCLFLLRRDAFDDVVGRYPDFAAGLSRTMRERTGVAET